MIDNLSNMAIMGIATESSWHDNQIFGNHLFDYQNAIHQPLDSVAGSSTLVNGTLISGSVPMSVTIPLEKPVTVKLLLCGVCKIHTNHRKTPSGAWVCWCGAVYAGSVQ